MSILGTITNTSIGSEELNVKSSQPVKFSLYFGENAVYKASLSENKRAFVIMVIWGEGLKRPHKLLPLPLKLTLTEQQNHNKVIAPCHSVVGPAPPPQPTLQYALHNV